MGRTDSDRIPFLGRGWQGESLRLVTRRQSNALVLCSRLVVGPCTFLVHGAGAVGRGSVCASCGLAAVSSVLLLLCLGVHIAKPLGSAGKRKLNFSQVKLLPFCVRTLLGSHFTCCFEESSTRWTKGQSTG